MQSPTNTCSHCILDNKADPNIVFDKDGVCNYCLAYRAKYGNFKPKTKNEIETLVAKIKKSSKNKKYDALLGISGGVDSSYLAMLVKDFGLNVLLVHFDNGWNSEVAVSNIEKTVNYTGFDLYTYVVNWEEFRDLQKAYIKAGVLDWEVPTDHGFFAVLHHIAYKQGINNILTGHNFQTEGILPKTMRWSKMDVANIKDIHNKFGTLKLKTFPMLGFLKLNYYKFILKLNRYNVLEWFDYRKDEVKEEIQEKLGWRDYGGKHYESIFTRFYQGYILINKFGFDKRQAHLSNLICSGQLTREQALEETKKPAYDAAQLAQDKAFFLKKMEFSEEDFEQIMKEKPVPHTFYKSYETGLYRNHEKWMQRIKPFTKLLRKVMGN